MTSPDGEGIKKVEGHAFVRFWGKWGGRGKRIEKEEGWRGKEVQAIEIMKRSEGGEEECFHIIFILEER